MAETEFSLKVTPEELRNKSSLIATNLATVKSDLEDISTLISGTDKYWLSEGGAHVRAKYLSLEPSRDVILNRLSEHPTDLDTIAGLYEVTETENDDLALELPGDVLD